MAARRWWVIGAVMANALTTGVALAEQVGPSPASSGAQPNIVIFLADDLGWHDTQPYGDKTVRTPNIDKLAAGGLAFDRAFIASPACAPSRAALLTGLMPARNGAEANQQAPNPDVRKLPSYLQALGYEVVAFGKVAHGGQGDRYGFDHFEHDGAHDDQSMPAAVAYMKARKDPRPLAIFVGSGYPHVPWPRGTEGYQPDRLTLPDKSVDTPITRTARARYYAAVSRLDAQLGQVISAADSLLGKNTVVMFSSDHGAQWPFAKWNLYDTGTRVPLIVRWAGHVKPGTRTEAMVSWVDILPTLVTLAGGKQPAGIDGQSFAAALTAGSGFKGRSEIFTTHNNDGSINVYPMRSVRTGRWKYISNLHPEYVYTTHTDVLAKTSAGGYFPSWRRAAESDPKAKAIVDAYFTRPKEELYDLSVDPDEHVNLAGDPKHAAILQTLRGQLSTWRTQQHDDHPVQGRPHLERPPIDGQRGPAALNADESD